MTDLAIVKTGPSRFAFMFKKAQEHAIWRAMKNMPSPGDVRRKEWAYIEPPASDLDPVWVQRSKDYWELQQATYGLQLTDFSMTVDYTRGVVTTYVVVQRVLPGSRVDEARHKAWFRDMLQHAELAKR